MDSAETFESFYRAMASLSFDTAAESVRQYAALSEQTGIFDKRIVFIITANVCAEALDIAKRVNDQGGDVLIYHVAASQDESKEAVNVGPHTRIVQLPVDSKLTEVL